MRTGPKKEPGHHGFRTADFIQSLRFSVKSFGLTLRGLKSGATASKASSNQPYAFQFSFEGKRKKLRCNTGNMNWCKFGNSLKVIISTSHPQTKYQNL